MNIFFLNSLNKNKGKQKFIARLIFQFLYTQKKHVHICISIYTLPHFHFCLGNNCYKEFLIYSNGLLTQPVTLIALILVTIEFGKFCICLYSRNILGPKLWEKSNLRKLVI